MTNATIEKPAAKAHILKKLITMAALFALIITSIAVIRCFPKKDSAYVDSVAGEIQHILSEFGSCIIGRMGIPYREKKINIISIALHAPHYAISSMSGNIGNLTGVSVKTAYSAVVSEN